MRGRYTPWKVFEGAELIASTAYATDAAVLVQANKTRTVKWDHRVTVWKGSAADVFMSVDYVADLMLDRREKYRAAAKVRADAKDKRFAEFMARNAAGKVNP